MCAECAQTVLNHVPTWLQYAIFYGQSVWNATYPVLRRYL